MLATYSAGCRLRTQAATPPASGDTRANTNAGVGPALTRDVLVAKGRCVAMVASRAPNGRGLGQRNRRKKMIPCRDLHLKIGGRL